ncbi:hypothetical protein FA95DRAFT_293545 [Auriscalpium vulgare]|uniref:Uncharacterized protein n=1 Tax=Auriscalpium vulgare TaxID=40419 RepID=A0ACB8RK05_9AGAM|nr:hypothetical protein FA95DRAFT_293545 [Auriscalpium vulgare]
MRLPRHMRADARTTHGHLRVGSGVPLSRASPSLTSHHEGATHILYCFLPTTSPAATLTVCHAVCHAVPLALNGRAACGGSPRAGRRTGAPAVVETSLTFGDAPPRRGAPAWVLGDGDQAAGAVRRVRHSYSGSARYCIIIASGSSVLSDINISPATRSSRPARPARLDSQAQRSTVARSAALHRDGRTKHTTLAAPLQLQRM